MNDMTKTIIPKSDQLNADDLLASPITITITGVTIRPGQEQPVSIHYECDEGKPYKPCKSMCRVMVSTWGADASKYTGRAMTLYCDPRVKWGGMEVGGIRISHMSDIDSAITMALTVTRANKKPFTVKPLAKAPAAQQVKSEPEKVAEADAPQPGQPAVSAAHTKAQEAWDMASNAIRDKFVEIDKTPIREMTEKAANTAARWLQKEIDKETEKA